MDGIEAKMARRCDPANFVITGMPPRPGRAVDEAGLHRVWHYILSGVGLTFSRFREEVRECLAKRDARTAEIAADLQTLRTEINEREMRLRSEIDSEIIVTHQPLQAQLAKIAEQVEALQQSVVIAADCKRRRPSDAVANP